MSLRAPSTTRRLTYDPETRYTRSLIYIAHVEWWVLIDCIDLICTHICRICAQALVTKSAYVYAGVLVILNTSGPACKSHCARTMKGGFWRWGARAPCTDRANCTWSPQPYRNVPKQKHTIKKSWIEDWLIVMYHKEPSWACRVPTTSRYRYSLYRLMMVSYKIWFAIFSFKCCAIRLFRHARDNSPEGQC